VERKAGRISYGGYLYHALILWIVSSIFAPPGTLAIPLRIFWLFVVWAITVGIASLSYRYLEQPIIAWARRKLERSEKATVPRTEAMHPGRELS
jgi:peptidoglycan/LPS O-acetylase OafA/YrhL